MCFGCNIQQCRWYSDRSFHFSIIWCMKRKWFSGRLNRKRYSFEPLSQLVLPEHRAVYMIVINTDSPFKRFIQELLSLAESM